MAERPGIMVYFDMAQPLKELDYEGKGRLLEAMLDYGQFGVVPEFNGLLTVAWGFIRPKLDADAKNYRKKVIKNTYSSYCAKEKKADRVPMELEEWLVCEGIDSEWNRMVSVDAERYPTPTTKTDTTPTTISMSNTKAEADGGGKGEEEPARQEDFEMLRRKQMAKLNGWGA